MIMRVVKQTERPPPRNT